MCGSRVTRWTSYGEELALWWSWMGRRSMGRDALDAEEEVALDLAQAGVSVASWPRASSYSPPRRARISSASAM
jgi:hypothetical protein